MDGFFDAVLVNAEDDKLKANRLAILAGLVASMDLVGIWRSSKRADMGKTDWRVYQFGNGAAEGDANMSDLLGGKGANLAK